MLFNDIFSNQSNRFKTEKQRNVLVMYEQKLIFSNVPRILWDESWTCAAAVKRHLPSAANEEFESPSHDHRK